MCAGMGHPVSLQCLGESVHSELQPGTYPAEIALSCNPLCEHSEIENNTMILYTTYYDTIWDHELMLVWWYALNVSPNLYKSQTITINRMTTIIQWYYWINNYQNEHDIHWHISEHWNYCEHSKRAFTLHHQWYYFQILSTFTLSMWQD